ncbi:MAG: cobalt ECF transporter T component CbiQ [Planctomycetes bacterium]|nr:cobalt ECF transporter T component CbiQ [Planctomycetota bacterium]
MIIFRVPDRSFIKNIDPRVRVLAAVALAVPVCLSERVAVLEYALGMAILLAILARVSRSQILRNLKELNFFMLLLAIFLPLVMAGTPVFEIGILTWTREGLWKALLITLRANTIMIALTALLGTMEPAHLGFALNRLGIPQKLTHVLLFMVRYIEVIHKEYHRLRDALRLRGFRPGCNRNTFRTFGYLIGLLLVRSIDRSERILEAMKCRGFRGRFYMLASFRFAAADVIFSVAASACVILLIWMEWS